MTSPTDPTIACFREEFDRFHGLLEQHIDRCPEDLWEARAGGYPYWQQLLHAFACVELYALPEGEPSRQTRYPRAVVMLSDVPESAMTRDEMRALAADMKTLAHAFMDGQSAATLTARHEPLCRFFGREITQQFALLGLVRHACYHLGCCDAILRERGLPGVY